MTETAAEGAAGTPKKRGSLAAMRIADLKTLAGGLGIAGADSLRKAQLVEAIKAAQSGGGSGGGTGGGAPKQEQLALPEQTPAEPDSREEPRQEQPSRRQRQQAPQQQPEEPQRPEQQTEQTQQDAQPQQGQQKQGQQRRQRQKQDQSQQDQQQTQQGQQSQKQQDQPKRDQGKQDQKQQRQQDQQQDQGQKQDQQQKQQQDQAGDQDDDGTGSRRSRRRRGRDNRETGGGAQRNRRNEPDTQVLEDDVLVPAAGILDVLENYAFVRTSGYLPGPDDVYLSLSLVRKFGLRRGDAVKGQVRQPREGERREKFNPMVRVDSINGTDPETARTRPAFDDLTAVHPSERIRLETGPEDVTGRVLDLAAPLGKGQRCLVRAAPRSGRTSLLRSLATSVTTNCPEAHLMVVLVSERPEEITDFTREVAGEVIASSFDRQPADHAGVAELAVERAKRLVELGHDVVLLLDGLTRLARAHNHAGTGGAGRTLPGGVDAAALLPPKQFFGAARALEEGGSLTIVATASVDTGAPTDELVAEELEGTANAEIRLSRELAGAGLHPAVVLAESGTRHVEVLLGEQEAEAAARLRSTLTASGDPAASLRTLLERLAATRTNIEMLTRVTKNGR